MSVFIEFLSILFTSAQSTFGVKQKRLFSTDFLSILWQFLMYRPLLSNLINNGTDLSIR